MAAGFCEGDSLDRTASVVSPAGSRPEETQANANEGSQSLLTSAATKVSKRESDAMTQALTAFCHALLNSAEFVYVD